jgi:hypothetical protein
MFKRIFTNIKLNPPHVRINFFTFAEKGQGNTKKKSDKQEKQIKPDKKSEIISQDSKKEIKPVGAQHSLENEKYNIVHNYDTSKISKENKQLLENIVTQFLRQEKVSSEEAENIKKSIRNPLSETIIPDMDKIHSEADIVTVLKTQVNLEWYYRSLKPFFKLLRDQREQRDMNDPNYIQIRSQTSLMRNQDMKFSTPKDIDVRQNVNSPDFLKKQPRLDLNYSYNYEEHKQYKEAYEKAKEEDKKQQLYKQKLIKYIKTYPNRTEVKYSLLKKNVVVPLDHLPDYDVDISDFKPPITKKSRRRYDKPKYEIDIKDYNCWRTWDRLQMIFNPKQAYLTVQLIPKNLVDVLFHKNRSMVILIIHSMMI